jgi:hypothetical protein
MLLKRKICSVSSSASDVQCNGRTVPNGSCPRSTKLTSSTTSNHLQQPKRTKTVSRLFQPGVKIFVQRASIFGGIDMAGNTQCRVVCDSRGIGNASKFQRPMLKRHAYGKRAEEALRVSSLGQKRRMDGMTKLMARAGRGLSFQLPNVALGSHGDRTESETDDSDDESKDKDRPFEPLCLWKCPSNGGEAKGLPPHSYVTLFHFVDATFLC